MNAAMHSVFIADDDGLIRETLTDATLGLGCEVRNGPSGAAALNAFAERPSDILVSDVDMPDISGFNLIDRLHEMDCFPDLILMSARGEPSLPEEARRIGAVRFLHKPIELPDYTATISRLLRL